VIPLIPLPSRPPVRKIEIVPGCSCVDIDGRVIEGCVCLKNPKDLMKNWIEIIEYVQILQKTGCFDKK
jgi:hypothetical protein